MKNIVSTIIVFGSIFILIVAGAFVFDKFNGFGLIENMDSSLNSSIKKVLESEEDIINNNHEKNDKAIENNNYIKDNISDNLSDNSSKYIETTAGDNLSNNDNKSGTVTLDNITLDNESILKDNNTIDNNKIDNNTPSDNISDGIAI